MLMLSVVMTVMEVTRMMGSLESVTSVCLACRVTGGELFEDIVAREYYSEADARWVCSPHSFPPSPLPTPAPVAHVCSCVHSG